MKLKHEIFVHGCYLLDLAGNFVGNSQPDQLINQFCIHSHVRFPYSSNMHIKYMHFSGTKFEGW